MSIEPSSHPCWRRAGVVFASASFGCRNRYPVNAGERREPFKQETNYRAIRSRWRYVTSQADPCRGKTQFHPDYDPNYCNELGRRLLLARHQPALRDMLIAPFGVHADIGSSLSMPPRRCASPFLFRSHNHRNFVTQIRSTPHRARYISTQPCNLRVGVKPDRVRCGRSTMIRAHRARAPAIVPPPSAATAPLDATSAKRNVVPSPSAQSGCQVAHRP